MFELVLFLSVYLFSIGIYGLITCQKYMVRALICLELKLNSWYEIAVGAGDEVATPQDGSRFAGKNLLVTDRR
jgi:NADH:ubiquinone oxidoreductase subunit K